MKENLLKFRTVSVWSTDYLRCST